MRKTRIELKTVKKEVPLVGFDRKAVPTRDTENLLAPSSCEITSHYLTYNASLVPFGTGALKDQHDSLWHIKDMRVSIHISCFLDH